MKVRLKKDLPFVQAGSIGTYINGRVIFEGYDFLMEEIKSESDWFEILPKEPIWAEEEWCKESSLRELVFNDNACTWISFDGSKRLPLILKAPDMWRLLKKVSESGTAYSAEAQELLNSIQ